ncbi:MAG TPA: hypothetical protein VGQ71_12745 [Terriglobales bacterium]|jgi:hypothetical protein|nr:hypothetical protein [Terriglobales bacterium]
MAKPMLLKKLLRLPLSPVLLSLTAASPASASTRETSVTDILAPIGYTLMIIAYAVKLIGDVRRRRPAAQGPVLQAEDRPHISNVLKGSALALVCSIIWSASFVSLSYVNRTVHPLELSGYLFGIACLVLKQARIHRDSCARSA